MNFCVRLLLKRGGRTYFCQDKRYLRSLLAHQLNTTQDQIFLEQNQLVPEPN